MYCMERQKHSSVEQYPLAKLLYALHYLLASPYARKAEMTVSQKQRIGTPPQKGRYSKIHSAPSSLKKALKMHGAPDNAALQRSPKSHPMKVPC